MVSGAALTLALMLGITVAASAQYRNYDDRYYRYDDQVRWSKERTQDYAYKLGYHNAYTEARRAYENGYRVSYRDMPGYRNDTNGYLAWMGHQSDYRSAYRRGYEAGFNDSLAGRPRRYNRQDVERVLGADLEETYEDPYYRNDPYYRGGRNRGHDDDYRYGRYGRSDIYRIAQQNGYRDGLRHGEEDRSRRRGYDYSHSDRYRDATSGYRSEYGDREAYRQGYRDGYRRGYDEGYRQNNSRSRWPF